LQTRPAPKPEVGRPPRASHNYKLELPAQSAENGAMAPSAENKHRVSFCPLARSDFPLLQRWLAAPHVAVWWNDPFDLASLEADYGPCIDGTEPVHVYVIEFDRVPIGWFQWYRWSDFPMHATQLGADNTAAGIDLAIGEITMTGRGLGPAVIRQFATDYIFPDPDMAAIVADPEVHNLRSVRAFKKAGFSIVNTVQLAGEGFERHVVRLDRSEK
jgi:aminoglycoside 6'-N-acetyltransferase